MRTFCFLTVFSFIAATSAFAADIYVDNDTGAPGYTEAGTWASTGNPSAGYNGGSYRFSRSTSGPSVATWTPTIPADGYYNVSAIFRRGADRSNAAPYTVNHADGSNTVNVDQTGSFSGDLGDVALGSYRFVAGTTGTVALSNATSASSVVFIADTIRFSPDPGPEVTQTRFAPLYPQGAQAFTALARVTDNTAITSVLVKWSAAPAGTNGEVSAFDDGAHSDGAANDGLFGGTMPSFAAGQTVTLHFEATDDHTITTVGPDVQVVIGATGNFQVRINEIVASNTGSAIDPDFGDTGDWVELYNTGPDVADLTGLTISDSTGNPTKWAFPAGTTIPANGYRIVWCDDYNTALDELHANFKLSASGESMVIYRPATSTVLDTVAFPALGSDQAYARFPNGTGSFATTIVTTPLAENLFAERGASPAFSQPSGLYAAPFNVTITAPADATEVRYTTDGSAPTAASTLYTAPINVTATTGLRATAFFASKSPSIPKSASYFFSTIADRTIPVLNIVMDPDDLFDPTTGIYANFNARGDNWERPAYAVFMNPDGSQVHESGVGIRINGGTSRGAAKKAFRLYLRNNYGQPSWSLPWLERTTADSFTNLVLRSNNNDGILNTSASEILAVTFFRDQILRDFHADTGEGALGVDGFFCALYLNGEYWGLYNACERIKSDYMQAKLGGGDDWDVVKGTWNSTLKYNTEALDGDLVAWNAFLAWLDANDVSTPAGLDGLKQRIEYKEFLRYFALNIIAQNHDWPQNNWIVTRHRTQPGAKWLFHENDAEWGLGLRPSGTTSDSMTWAQGNNYMISTGHNHEIAPLCKLFNGSDWDPTPPASPVNGILDNPQGRIDFIAAVEELLNFEMSAGVAIPKIDAYEDRIATEVPRESARWAANNSAITSAAAFNANWPTAVQNIRNFVTNRPATIRSLMQSKFTLSGTRTVTFEKAGTGSGTMQIYGRTVALPWTGTFFDASVLHLVAVPGAGSSFGGYTGAVTSASANADYTATTGANTTVTLTFTAAAPVATDAWGVK